MILGIGTDITEVARFSRWIKNPEMIKRFFNEAEIMEKGTESARCQHYAVRFAAKEAFSKALGTGLSYFELKDVYISKDELGKPVLNVEKSARDALIKFLGNEYKLHVTLSHEKEYAVAFVIIEK